MQFLQSDTDDTPATRKTQNSSSKDRWEILRFAFISLLIIIPFRWFIAQPFMVNGSSMDPTFANRDYLIVDQISYRFDDIKRGDVVVFRAVTDPRKFFIKRIIGLPGETIEVAKDEVNITLPGQSESFLYDEPYLIAETPGSTRVVLGDEEFFVMGDNRGNSSDSRFWGALPRSNIIGRAFLRLFPFTDVGILPGDYKPSS